MNKPTLLGTYPFKTEAFELPGTTQLLPKSWFANQYITTNQGFFQPNFIAPSDFKTDLDDFIPTSGSGTSSYFEQIENYINTILGHKDLTKNARDKIRSLENKEQVRTAIFILKMIDEQLSRQSNTSYLPEINAFELDDGSLLLEWIFPNLRLGFSIEPNTEESSWFLVSNTIAGNINAYGRLFCEKVNLPIKWLISLITSNPQITT